MNKLLKTLFATVFAVCTLAFAALAANPLDYVPEDAVLVAHVNSNDLFTCPSTAINMMVLNALLNGSGYTLEDFKVEVTAFVRDGGNNRFEAVARIGFASNSAGKLFRELKENLSCKESKVGTMPVITQIFTDEDDESRITTVEVILLDQSHLQFHYSTIPDTKFGKVYEPVGGAKGISAYFAEQKLSADSTLMLFINLKNLKSKSVLDEIAKTEKLTDQEVAMLNSVEKFVIQLKLQGDGGMTMEADSKMKPGTDMAAAKAEMDELKKIVDDLKDKPGLQGKNYGTYSSGVKGDHVFARLRLTAEGFLALIQTGISAANELVPADDDVPGEEQIENNDGNSEEVGK